MRQETIENYLKTIYHLSADNKMVVTNKQLALQLKLNPATVTESLKKLNKLKLITYEKSYGTQLTQKGINQAVVIIRRHRVWETYLANELGFGWDEVHEIAEELEHVSSKKLIDKLALKLGNPLFDPHGEPIPDDKGNFRKSQFIKLIEARPGKEYILTGVADHSADFLHYIDRLKLKIGEKILVMDIEKFDSSVVLKYKDQEYRLSLQVASNILVR